MSPQRECPAKIRTGLRVRIIQTCETGRIIRVFPRAGRFCPDVLAVIRLDRPGLFDSTIDSRFEYELEQIQEERGASA